MNRGHAFLATAMLLLAAAPAQAHFLFVHIGPPAEGGRYAEVYFSELADAGDPRFTEKIAHTTLWLQTAPGKFEPLKVHKASDRLRALVPATGNLVVIGHCQYGVLARPNKTPFLLRHFPKAIAGNPDELNRMKPFEKVPLEIVATVEGETIRFAALKDGKPLPKAEFITIDEKLNNVKLPGDDEGKAAWKPPTTGKYSVYIAHTSKANGEVDGKKYEEIRDFATVAFDWPLQRSDADAEAVKLFQEAIAARAMWKDFAGFRADVTASLDGRRFAGVVSVDAKGTVVVLHEDPTQAGADSGWVQEQLESIVLHRGARAGSSNGTQPVLRFADAKTNHPLGRLLIFDGGRFASSYRVKDKQLLVVNRNMGKQNMTLTILDNDKNPEGLFLPRSYTVQYWDAATGDLKRTESIQQRWQRVGTLDLPVQHTVAVGSESGLSVRSFTLSKHELLKK